MQTVLIQCPASVDPLASLGASRRKVGSYTWQRCRIKRGRASSNRLLSYFFVSSTAWCLYPLFKASSAPSTKTLAHSTSEAARKPAKAQMRTFWKNVACTPFLKATMMPVTQLFAEDVDLERSKLSNLRRVLIRHETCGFFEMK